MEYKIVISANTETLPAGPGDGNAYTSAKTNSYTSIAKNGAAAVICRYDADGNLLDDGTWLYSYDYMGRRTKKVTDIWLDPAYELIGAMEERYFAYDGWNVIYDYHRALDPFSAEEMDHGQEHFVWGQDVSGTLQGAGGVGGLLMAQWEPFDWLGWWMTQPAKAHFYQYDGNGNVSEIIHESGLDIGQYRYDSFGQPLGSELTLYYEETTGMVLPVEYPINFSTKWRESTHCMIWDWGQSANARNRLLQYYGHRHYAPQLGRWINRDPIEERGGLNLYGMVGNDPVGRVDVLGRQSIKFPPPKLPPLPDPDTFKPKGLPTDPSKLPTQINAPQVWSPKEDTPSTSNETPGENDVEPSPLGELEDFQGDVNVQKGLNNPTTLVATAAAWAQLPEQITQFYDGPVFQLDREPDDWKLVRSIGKYRVRYYSGPIDLHGKCVCKYLALDSILIGRPYSLSGYDFFNEMLDGSALVRKDFRSARRHFDEDYHYSATDGKCPRWIELKVTKFKATTDYKVVKSGPLK